MFMFLYAADIEITTAVDRQTVPVNQTVQYTLAVDSAADIPGLNLPAMNDFVVVGQSSATQIQIVNGKQTGSRSYIYVLQPKQQGKEHNKIEGYVRADYQIAHGQKDKGDKHTKRYA